MTFFQRVDIVEPYVFYADLSSIFLEPRHLLIGAAFVVEHKVPRQVLILGWLWVGHTDLGIELHTDWHIPSERLAIELKPHVWKFTFLWYVFIEKSFDFLQAICEIIESRDHHVETPWLSIAGNFEIVQGHF